MLAKIKSDEYIVYVGEIFTELRRFISRPAYRSSRVFILADEHTLRQCLPVLLMHTEILQHAQVLEINSGEEYKNIETCMQVWEALAELGADRTALFVNLGGGVISDMGGFIAATFKRGIDFINIPTTLLAQVDASVGGKLGIDFNGVKNQVGMFCNPKAVFVSPEFIKTQERRQVLSGFAEIIKYALITDAALWNKLHHTDITKIPDLTDLIITSIRIKNKIVLTDPYEKGLRKLLNFGHTVGHAVESYSLSNDASPLMHGEAVAIGMVCEAYLSFLHNSLPEKVLTDIVDFLKKQYPPYPLSPVMFDALISLMFHDKKNIQGKINFTLLDNIGSSLYDCFCPEEDVRRALSFYHSEFSTSLHLN